MVHCRLNILPALGLIALVACSGGSEPTPTPTVTQSAPGTPDSSAPTPTPVTDGSGPGATPGTLSLEVSSPQDGAGSEIGAVRVFGRTRADAVVGVNGVPVTPGADGSFQHDVVLTSGINLIEVVATDIGGETLTEQIAVFGVSPTAALPLSLFYPPDGLEVSQQSIRVMGGTRQDAVIGVNGAPAEINSLGIFETEVPLELGANLIEVVAADINDNVSFRTAVVFRSQ